MKTIMITGTSRGLGFEFVRQYLNAGERVIATCRNSAKAEALGELERDYPETLSISELDVSSMESIEEAAKRIRRDYSAIDILINNAGVAVWTPFEELTMREMEDVIRVNTMAPIFVTRCFLPLLRNGSRKLIVNISSVIGSIAQIEALGNAGSLPYNASKTALNMIGKMLALSLREEGIIVLQQGPGWVKTEMGGEGAEIMPEESISAMRRIFERVTIEDSGRFLNWNGEEMPW